MDKLVFLAHTVSLDNYLETVGKQALADGLVTPFDCEVKIVMNKLALEPTISVYVGSLGISIGLKNCIVAHSSKDKTWTIAKSECWSDFKRSDVLLSIDHFAYELLNVWTAS
jgi:hypothetical protein